MKAQMKSADLSFMFINALDRCTFVDTTVPAFLAPLLQFTNHGRIGGTQWHSAQIYGVINKEMQLFQPVKLDSDLRALYDRLNLDRTNAHRMIYLVQTHGMPKPEVKQGIARAPSGITLQLTEAELDAAASLHTNVRQSFTSPAVAFGVASEGGMATACGESAPKKPRLSEGLHAYLTSPHGTARGSSETMVHTPAAAPASNTEAATSARAPPGTRPGRCS
jgi:hypothetical protein